MTKYFAFGKNWQNFIENYLNSERVNEAKKSLINFCKGKNLIKGKTFIDIGCGSGLFSLAAYQLGASKILSIDVDEESVKCCQYLRERYGKSKNWEILNKSILNNRYLDKLKKFDFVYSWGVLHHTGKMWTSLRNTLNLVKKNGYLYIAIYNKADSWNIYEDGRFGTSFFWKKEKQFYNNLPVFLQNLIDYSVMLTLIVVYILTLNNPLKKIKGHKKLRGMSWAIDIKDWLGGYPYEYASASEIVNFVKKFGFRLKNIKINNGLLNNEFLFKKN